MLTTTPFSQELCDPPTRRDLSPGNSSRSVVKATTVVARFLLFMFSCMSFGAPTILQSSAKRRFADGLPRRRAKVPILCAVVSIDPFPSTMVPY